MSKPDYFEVAAISLALHDYMDSSVHDTESYTITIQRKPARRLPDIKAPFHTLSKSRFSK